MPNVLLICTDQQRYNSLGCTGHPCAETPHLDALAADGCLLNSFIVANPICMPSRASLMTGRYPAGHGVSHNGIELPRTEYRLPFMEEAVEPVELPTIADIFGQAGFATGAFGKLHLTPSRADPRYGYHESYASWAEGRQDDWHGPYYGFDHVELTSGHGDWAALEGGHYATWLRDAKPGMQEAIRRQQQEADRPCPGVDDCYVSALDCEHHHSTWVTDRCIDWIGQQSSDSNFFAWVGFPDPHHPFTPPAELWDVFQSRPCVDPADQEGALLTWTPGEQGKRLDTQATPIDAQRFFIRATDAMNHLIDRNVGRLVHCLKDRGLYEDTIIVFTSDHGEFLGDHGLLRKGGTGCRALLQVPGIIRDPQQRLGRTLLPACGNVDLLPTLADLAGVPCSVDIDGRSLLDDAHPGQAMASCANVPDPMLINHSLFTERWRLTWYPRLDRWLLVDQVDDPHETIDVAERHPEVVEELGEALRTRVARSWSPRQGRVALW